MCPKPGGGLGRCPLAGMGGAGVGPWEPRDSAGAAPSSVLRVLRARHEQDSRAAEEAKQEASPGPRRRAAAAKDPCGGMKTQATPRPAVQTGAELGAGPVPPAQKFYQTGKGQSSSRCRDVQRSA